MFHPDSKNEVGGVRKWRWAAPKRRTAKMGLDKIRGMAKGFEAGLYVHVFGTKLG
jgi:hypothetical protein